MFTYGIAIDFDKAQEVTSNIAEAAGQEEVGKYLNIALDYAEHRDNMKSMSALLESLVSTRLSEKQYITLKQWDQKLDAVLDIAKVFPDSAGELIDFLGKATEGKISIYHLDSLVHAAIEGYQKLH